MQSTDEERWNEVRPILMRRAARWTEAPEAIVDAVRVVAQSRPPPDLATSLVRTLCRAWTTTARFHNPVVLCHFCGDPESDRQSHYLACAVFRRWLHERARWDDQPADGNMTAWLMQRSGQPDPILLPWA